MIEDKKSHEKKRLKALKEYDVLDTPNEASFDRIARLVQSTMQTPIALVSLIDKDRQWFKSHQGLDVSETHRDFAFCSHTIEHHETMIVPDATKDIRFSHNPLVTGAPDIRFYIGVPLRSPDGYNIGTLCAIDTKPRDVTDDQVNILQDLARLVVDELELRKLATTDCLTGAMTRRAFETEMNKEFDRAKRHHKDMSLVLFDLDHFKEVNDLYGHAAGDLKLQNIISICKEEVRPIDAVGRLGGEEFAILLPETGLEGAQTTAERVRESIAKTETLYASSGITVTASFGVTELSSTDTDLDTLILRADKALYEAKNKGRNQVCSAMSGNSNKDYLTLAAG